MVRSALGPLLARCAGWVLPTRPASPVAIPQDAPSLSALGVDRAGPLVRRTRLVKHLTVTLGVGFGT
jgi:hypothetical protein